MKKKGLVLDGGGVFGIGQAHILANVDTSKFDFFVGTSIGSVLASTLAHDVEIDYVDFFHTEMPNIFKTDMFHKYNPFNPKYPDKELKRALQEVFGDSRKLMYAKKPLFITSANLAEARLKVFNSEDLIDGNRILWEVLRSATSAETYFEPFNGFADGGVFANNPSMVAIASACKILGCCVHDIQLCSIGTGSVPLLDNTLSQPNKNYTLFMWGKWLLKALLGGASNSMHEYFVNSLPVDKHVRIDFKRESDWKMDSPKDMLKAEKAWELKIKQGIEIVKDF